MAGKKIASTSGSIYDRWIKNCFKDTTFQTISSPSAGVLALKNEQVDAFMYDDAFLVGVAANDSTTRLTIHRFLDVPWGIGIRKGETSMKAWVDAAIRGMKARDMFWPILSGRFRDGSTHLPEQRPEPEGDSAVSAGEPAGEQLP